MPIDLGVIHLVRKQFFVKKMTPPPPLIRTCKFCNTHPPHPSCVRTNLLYSPPLLCKIEFFVQNFIRFRDAAYYVPKDYTLFNFLFALLIFTTKQCFLNKHGYMNLPKYRSFLWNFYSKFFFLGQHASNIFKKQVQNTHFNKTI